MFLAAPQEVEEFLPKWNYELERRERPKFATPCNTTGCCNAAAWRFQYCCGTCMLGWHNWKCVRTARRYMIPDIPRNIALRGKVLLISAGYLEAGTRWLVDFFSNGDPSEQEQDRHENLWHRLDVVYNSKGHLCKRGTHPRAQQECERVFGKRFHNAIEMTMYLVKWYALAGVTTIAHVILCAHGHHRSVAHVEASVTQIHRRFPGMQVVTAHLDHEDTSWTIAYPDASYGPLSAGDPDYDNWCWFENNIRYPYDCTLVNPPPFLMHEGLR